MLLESLELQTNSPESVLRLSGVERFADGSGYRCRLEVRSRGFVCDRRFFFDRWSLAKCIESLDHMVRGASGVAVLKEQFESDYIRFTQNAQGHVTVDGEIFERPLQHLHFTFRTDQTVLPELLEGLRRWVAA